MGQQVANYVWEGRPVVAICFPAPAYQVCKPLVGEALHISLEGVAFAHPFLHLIIAQVLYKA